MFFRAGSIVLLFVLLFSRPIMQNVANGTGRPDRVPKGSEEGGGEEEGEVFLYLSTEKKLILAE